jgi:hypothetical protein
MAPTSIEETSGTLSQAAHAIDPHSGPPKVTDPRSGQPWADSSVYIVTMRGKFTYNGPQPKNSPRVTGSVLTIAVDAKNGFVVAEVLSNSAKDLHEINPTVTKLGA